MGEEPALDAYLNVWEKVCPGSSVVCWKVRYGVWDVRQHLSNRLSFMVVSLPENGKIVVDKDTIARCYAVRLVIEVARIVITIGEAGKKAEIVAELSKAIGNSLNLVGLSEKVARELTSTKELLKMADSAAALVGMVSSMSEEAGNLVDSRSDRASEMFLSRFLGTTVPAFQDRASMIALVIKASMIIGVPVENWIDELYNEITRGELPLLTAIAVTYGQLEATNALGRLQENA